MGGHGQELLIKDMLVYLFAAGLIVPVLRMAKLPAVAGFILAGVVLGPSGLGAFSDTTPLLTFITVSDPHAAEPFAELGVLFLLFLLGLEMSFEKLWALRRLVFGAGAVQAGVSALAIGGVLFLMGTPAVAAAAIGLALALSSTAIVMQLLIDEHKAATMVGRVSLGVLLFQDILVAPILIFVGFASHSGDGGLISAVVQAVVNGVLALGLIYVIGRFVLRRVFHLAARVGGRDFLMALTLLAVVGAAVTTSAAGLSLALGAFLAGLLLGETEFKHQTEVDLEPFKGLLLGLFFMTVGMSLDLRVIYFDLPLVLGGLIALLVAKFVIATVACRLFAGRNDVALETAGLLAPAGEFAFVVLAACLSGGLIDRETVTIVSAVAGMSMLMTPLLWKASGWAAGKLRVESAPGAASPEIAYDELEGHVILAGFGRVGQAIAHVLEKQKAEFVALERSAPAVALLRAKGWRVYLGDASRMEILEKAGIRGAALIAVTVDDAASAERMVRAVRAMRPEAPILARAHNEDHARALHAAGANFVVPDAIEAGLQIAARALTEFGYEGETVRDLLASVRESEYRIATKAAE